MESEPTKGRQYAAALFLFLVVTFVFTYPTVFKLDTHLIGSPRGDKFQFIWNFWWTRHALFELGRLPFFCPVQYYPTGVSLALHDTTYFWAFLSIPLQSVFDLRTILGLFLLVSFPLNAMAFYHLARHVAGSHRGAVAGSLMFAFCPYLVGRFHVCHIQYLGVFMLPLFLLGIHRYCRSGHVRYLISAGIYFCLTALISYYYAAALALILACVLCYRAMVSRKDTRQRKRLLAHVIVFTVLVATLLAPFVLPALTQLSRGDYQFGEEPANNSADNSGDLISYLVPDTTIANWAGWEVSRRAAQWARGVNGALQGNILEKSVYPGWISILALLAAVLWRPLRSDCWPWALLAVSFFMLSLGPTLHVKGAVYFEKMLPYRFLSELPLFGIMRSPARLAVFIPLGAGLVVASGCARLKRLCRRDIYRIASLGLVLFVFFEFLPEQTYFSPNNYYRSPYYRRLADNPAPFAVLNVPVDYTAATGGGDIYVYAQTIHRKPILGGYVSREPDNALQTLRDYPFLKTLARRANGAMAIPAPTETGRREMRRTFTGLQVGRVVLHRPLLTPEEQAGLAAWFQPVLGEPVFVDPWIIVFTAPGGSPDFLPKNRQDR
jgi:hypothetical protein